MTKLVPTIRQSPAGADTSSSPKRPWYRAALAYPARLWQAEIPLSSLFWVHMTLAGTAVNLVAMGLAFLAVGLGASTLAGILIFFAPMPYNLLLVASIWKRADMERGEWAWPARLGSLVWLVVSFLL